MLEDTFAVIDFLAKHIRPVKRNTEGLLNIHVLACTRGCDRNRDVPIIACCNFNTVQIFTGQQFAEITIRGASSCLIMVIHTFCCLIAPALEHVARGNDLRVRIGQYVSESAITHAAAPNERECHTVGGCRFPVLCA